jgi:Amt family ammonium transporter
MDSSINVPRIRWYVFFAVLVAVSIGGLFVSEPPELFDENINEQTEFVISEAQDTVIDGKTEHIDKVVTHLSYADIAWMITATALVMLMTPGLSYFYGGMVGSKNVISTMLQSVVAMGLISIIWVVVGFSLAFGKDVGGLGLIGDPRTFFMFQNVGASPLGIDGLTLTIPLALFALFQLKFAIITPALITGSFAERIHFSGYLLFITLFSLFIYAPLAHCVWHPSGFLSNVLFVKDFAGGIVVHAASGIAALAGAIYLGRRNGKPMPANMPMVILGACLLWFGWFGFNGGSTLNSSAGSVKAFLNTNTATAAAMLAWIFFDTILGRKPSGMGVAVGAVVGLVAITPSAGWVTVGQSLFIGTFTGIFCNLAVRWKNKSTVDDALDVFPTHGIGGIVGTILTAIFVEGLLAGQVDHFIGNLIAVVLVFLYTFIGSLILYWITDKSVRMRISEENENLGLDISQHGEVAFSETQKIE